MIVTASPKTAVKINIELTQQEASHLFSILLAAGGDGFAQEFADRIELSMAASQTCPAEYAAMCGITDEMRMDFIDQTAKAGVFELQENTEQKFQPAVAAVPLKMFTIQTQRIFGHTARELIDVAITGKQITYNLCAYYARWRK